MGEAAAWSNNPTKSGYTDTKNIPNEGASLSFAEYDFNNTTSQNTTQITKQTHDTNIQRIARSRYIEFSQSNRFLFQSKKQTHDTIIIRNVKFTSVRKSKIENHVTEVSPERTRRFRQKLYTIIWQKTLRYITPDKNAAVAHRQGNKKAYINWGRCWHFSFQNNKRLYDTTIGTSDDMLATRGPTLAAPPNRLMLRTCNNGKHLRRNHEL